MTRLGRAIVIGASIAGSSAAAALSTRFDEVLVIDRDALPDGPGRRRGAPHAAQFHTLNSGGRLKLEALFPGFTEELRQAGVPFADTCATTAYCSRFGWFPFARSDTRSLHVTRRRLEWHLRDRASHLPNVRFVQRAPAVGLMLEDDTVVGIRTAAPSDDGVGDEEEVRGDLVLDASGRSSITPRWLEELGYPSPLESIVDAHWGYATTYVTVPDSWDPGWLALYIAPTVTGNGPEATRGAAMWRQEDDLVVVTAQGCAGDVPPTDYDDYLAWISSFGTDVFRSFLEEFGDRPPIVAWRSTANQLRDYAAVPTRPENLVVVGDAVAAFNPIYGQGMALAAMGALQLRDSLDAQLVAQGSLRGFAERFQRDLKMLVDPAWEFSTNSDYSVPGVEVDDIARSGWSTRSKEYTDRVLALATEDADLAVKFMETIHMIRDVGWMSDSVLHDRVHAEWDRLGRKRRDLALRPF